MIRLTRRLQLLAEEGDPAFSFEFFVPETEEGEDDLHLRIERLAAVAPPTAIEFVAGGVGVAIGRTPYQEARRAVLACSRTKKTSHLSAMLRLSSSWPLSRGEWEALSDEVRGLDITNLVVEKGQTLSTEGGSTAAAAFGQPTELVSFLRARHGDFFCIGAVGYPHVPPHLKTPGEAPAAAAERLLGSVVSQLRAGCDFVLAQHVLDEGAFLRYRDALYARLLADALEAGSGGSSGTRQEGVCCCGATASSSSPGRAPAVALPPVLPCLLPVHDLQTFFDANAYCGVPIPQEMLQELVQAPAPAHLSAAPPGSLQRVQAVGNAWIARLCRELLSWTPVTLPASLPAGTVTVPYLGACGGSGGVAASPQAGAVSSGAPATPTAAAASISCSSCSCSSGGTVGLVLHGSGSGGSSPVPLTSSALTPGPSGRLAAGGQQSTHEAPGPLTIQLPPAVPFVHFHTFNLETVVRGMLSDLALSSPAAAPRRKLPWRPSCEERRAGEEVRPIHWANRPVSYVERTASWAEFPTGRWTATAQRSFDSLPEERLVPHTAGSAEARRAIWGVPRSEAEVWAVFAAYVEGKVPRLPWCDMSLHPETATIRQPLIDLNRCGFLTINSQPRVNGARSDDPTFGWGGAGGYVYQKAYVECFCPATHLAALMQALAAPANASVTFHAVDAAGRTYTNCPRARGVHAVTWGVFPAKEIVQPTVVDPDAFLAWKDEAFGLWRQQWAGAYEEDSAACELIHSIADSYFLVCLVDNDYIGGDVFRPFHDALGVLRETGVALPALTASGGAATGTPSASPVLLASASVFALSSLSPSASSVALNALVASSGGATPLPTQPAGARRELQGASAPPPPPVKVAIPASLPAGPLRLQTPVVPSSGAAAVDEPITAATVPGLPSSLAGLLSAAAAAGATVMPAAAAPAAAASTPAALRLPAPVGLGTFHPSPGTSSPAFSMPPSLSGASLAAAAETTKSGRTNSSSGGAPPSLAGIALANTGTAPQGRAGLSLPGAAPQTSTTTIQGLAVPLPPTFSQPTTASATTATGLAGAAAVKAGALTVGASAGGSQAPAPGTRPVSGPVGARSPSRP